MKMTDVLQKGFFKKIMKMNVFIFYIKYTESSEISTSTASQIKLLSWKIYIPSTGKYALHDIILYFMIWCASLTDQWVAITWRAPLPHERTDTTENTTFPHLRWSAVAKPRNITWLSHCDRWLFWLLLQLIAALGKKDSGCVCLMKDCL